MSPYTYDYPRPALTADIILFLRSESPVHVLLIKRKYPPFKDCWALPGGFMDMHETLEQAAIRELEEETGIVVKELLQFKTFDKPDRDPRGRTISTVFYAFLQEKPAAKASDDASELLWYSINKLPELAFDHKDILTEAAKLSPEGF